VTKLSGNDLHSARDLFLQTSLMLTFGATLATAGPLDAGEVLGLVRRTARLARLGTGGLGFRRDGLVWEVLWQNEEAGSSQHRVNGDRETSKGQGWVRLSARHCVPTLL
jgi:hypothetical protein